MHGFPMTVKTDSKAYACTVHRCEESLIMCQFSVSPQVSVASSQQKEPRSHSSDIIMNLQYCCYFDTHHR